MPRPVRRPCATFAVSLVCLAAGACRRAEPPAPPSEDAAAKVPTGDAEATAPAPRRVLVGGALGAKGRFHLLVTDDGAGQASGFYVAGSAAPVALRGTLAPRAGGLHLSVELVSPKGAEGARIEGDVAPDGAFRGQLQSARAK